jgi:hypothetical protein
MDTVTFTVLLLRAPKEVFDYFEAIELSGLISVKLVVLVEKRKPHSSQRDLVIQFGNQHLAGGKLGCESLHRP